MSEEFALSFDPTDRLHAQIVLSNLHATLPDVLGDLFEHEDHVPHHRNALQVFLGRKVPGVR